jgi:hypothetical protein
MQNKLVNFVRLALNTGFKYWPFTAVFFGVFRQTLHTGRDQPCRYYNNDSKSVARLNLLFQSNKPNGSLGEARQSGNSAVTTEVAVLSRWVRIF